MAIRWGPTARGKIALEKNDDLKSCLGWSPDRVDAANLAFYARAVRATADIELLKMG